MSIKELAELIGKTKMWKIPQTEVKINVKILDVKQSYGNIRYLIEPISGEGQMWVQNIT